VSETPGEGVADNEHMHCEPHYNDLISKRSHTTVTQESECSKYDTTSRKNVKTDDL